MEKDQIQDHCPKKNLEAGKRHPLDEKIGDQPKVQAQPEKPLEGSFECEFCGQKFGSQSWKTRHEATCTKKLEEERSRFSISPQKAQELTDLAAKGLIQAGVALTQWTLNLPDSVEPFEGWEDSMVEGHSLLIQKHFPVEKELSPERAVLVGWILFLGANGMSKYFLMQEQKENEEISSNDEHRGDEGTRKDPAGNPLSQ